MLTFFVCYFSPIFLLSPDCNPPINSISTRLHHKNNSVSLSSSQIHIDNLHGINESTFILYYYLEHLLVLPLFSCTCPNLFLFSYVFISNGSSTKNAWAFSDSRDGVENVIWRCIEIVAVISMMMLWSRQNIRHVKPQLPAEPKATIVEAIAKLLKEISI